MNYTIKFSLLDLKIIIMNMYEYVCTRLSSSDLYVEKKLSKKSLDNHNCIIDIVKKKFPFVVFFPAHTSRQPGHQNFTFSLG